MISQILVTTSKLAIILSLLTLICISLGIMTGCLSVYFWNKRATYTSISVPSEQRDSNFISISTKDTIDVPKGSAINKNNKMKHVDVKKR